MTSQLPESTSARRRQLGTIERHWLVCVGIGVPVRAHVCYNTVATQTLDHCRHKNVTCTCLQQQS